LKGTDFVLYFGQDGAGRWQTVQDGGPGRWTINSNFDFQFYVTAALGNINAGALRVIKSDHFCIE
jgi:hypothetical protein